MMSATKTLGSGSERRVLCSEMINILRCDICFMDFYKSEQFDEHLRQHNEGILRLCPHCNKSFLSEDQLNEHLHCQSPSEMKDNISSNHKCKECGAFFANRNCLVFHQITHDGLHRCPICEKRFIHHGVLNKHMMRFHSQPDFDSPVQVSKIPSDGGASVTLKQNQIQLNSSNDEEPLEVVISDSESSDIVVLASDSSVSENESTTKSEVSTDDDLFLPVYSPQKRNVSCNNQSSFVKRRPQLMSSDRSSSSSEKSVLIVNENSPPTNVCGLDDKLSPGRTCSRTSRKKLFVDKDNANCLSPTSSHTLASTKINFEVSKCQYCLDTFTDEKSLLIHIRKMHKEFISPEKLQEPEEITNSPTPSLSPRMFLCPACGIRLGNERSFKQHKCENIELKDFDQSRTKLDVIQRKPQNSEEGDIPPTGLGQEVVPRSVPIGMPKIHIPRLEDQPYQCSICFQRFGKAHALDLHEKQHKWRLQKVIPDSEKCNPTNTVLLDSRINSCLYSKDFLVQENQLERCNSSATNIAKKHSNISCATGSTPAFKCLFCPQTFSTRRGQSVHSAIHKKGTSLPENVNGDAFRININEKVVFPCTAAPRCSKAFPSITRMKYHSQNCPFVQLKTSLDKFSDCSASETNHSYTSSDDNPENETASNATADNLDHEQESGSETDETDEDEDKSSYVKSQFKEQRKHQPWNPPLDYSILDSLGNSKPFRFPLSQRVFEVEVNLPDEKDSVVNVNFPQSAKSVFEEIVSKHSSKGQCSEKDTSKKSEDDSHGEYECGIVEVEIPLEENNQSDECDIICDPYVQTENKTESIMNVGSVELNNNNLENLPKSLNFSTIEELAAEIAKRFPNPNWRVKVYPENYNQQHPFVPLPIEPLDRAPDNNTVESYNSAESDFDDSESLGDVEYCDMDELWKNLHQRKQQEYLSAQKNAHNSDSGIIKNGSSAATSKFFCRFCCKKYRSVLGLGLRNHIQVKHPRVHVLMSEKGLESSSSSESETTEKGDQEMEEVPSQPPVRRLKVKLPVRCAPDSEIIVNRPNSNKKNGISNSTKPLRDMPKKIIRTTDGKFLCHWCGRTFTLEYNLKRHFTQVHRVVTSQSEIEAKFFCKLCPRSYTLDYNLKRHMKKDHPQSSISYVRKHFTCPYCPKVCLNSYNLDKHIQAVHAQDCRSMYLKRKKMVGNNNTMVSLGKISTTASKQQHWNNPCTYPQKKTYIIPKKVKVEPRGKSVSTLAEVTAIAKFSPAVTFENKFTAISSPSLNTDNVEMGRKRAVKRKFIITKQTIIKNPSSSGSQNKNHNMEDDFIYGDGEPEDDEEYIPTSKKRRKIGTRKGLTRIRRQVKLNSSNTFVCRKCGKVFLLQCTLQRHYNICARHHMDPIDKANTCKICDKIFTDAGRRDYHLKLYHSDTTKDYECNICLRRFTTHTSTERHKRQVHNIK